MNLHAAICWLAICLALAATGPAVEHVQAQSAPGTRKACDFLSKADAEALLGTSVQDRSQGLDCFFVQTGWTNKPPMNKAIRFGLSDAASPQPDAVIDVRRNAEQYLPPGGAIREISDFADAAYWLWIPGFGGTLTAFQGGKVIVSVNITGLPEQEALRKAETLASKPLGGSGPTGYAYRGPAPQLRASAGAPASPTVRTFCSSDPNQAVVYVSAEFGRQLTASVAEETIALALVGDDFQIFLEDTYHYRSDSDADCFHGFGMPESRADWEVKERRAGKRIVETTWTPPPDSNQ